MATSFIFDDRGRAFKIIGNTSEGKGHTALDPVFKKTIKYFENTAFFEQKIKVSEIKTSLVAIVEFMACDDTKCLPPKEAERCFDLVSDTSSKNDAVAAITSSTDSENKGVVLSGLYIFMTKHFTLTFNWNSIC